MEEISPYFGKIFRIKIIDDRIIEGEFQAVDKDMSIGKFIFYFFIYKVIFIIIIVLGSGIEYHGVPNGDGNNLFYF